MTDGRLRRAAVRLLSFAALAAALVGARTALAQSTDLAALEQAANAEGELVVYHSLPDSTFAAMTKGFEAKYPKVKVRARRMVSGTLFARVTAEAESGVKAADLLIAGSSGLFQERPELFQDLSALAKEAKVGVKPKNGSYVVTYITPHVVTYNKNLVSAADLKAHLSHWKDLADPFWKDKIEMSDPLATPSNMSWFKLMRDSFGDAWMKKLAANNPKFVEGASVSVQHVAAGAFSLSTPTTVSHSAAIRAQGAPVGFVQPEGPAHGLESSMAVLKNVPHPNSARLFARWLMSMDGQKVVCAIQSVPVIPNVEGDCVKLSPQHSPAVELIPDTEQKAILDLLGRS